MNLQEATEYLRLKKQNANSQLCRAVKDGHLKRTSFCQRCGAQGRIHGHHEDYESPLLVEWLCSKCHGQQHASRHYKNAADIARGVCPCACTFCFEVN